ncbi:hypothetical protein ACLB2K_054180 [Fragaria x ananassa]
MEIPLLRYQTLSLDQIQRSISFPLSFSDSKFPKQRSLFSGCSFYLNRPKWKNPFSRIRCCSYVEQQLKPRPRPIPAKFEVEEIKAPPLAQEEAQIAIPSSGICSQIEKLVLYKRYREALEMFEFLESKGGYEVGGSTYDALVSACISLRSIRGVKRVFGYMISNGFELDQYMRNRVLLMHVKCGMMIDARQLFGEMPERNSVSWNTIIGGLVDCGEFVEAFGLFLDMWEEICDGESRVFATMIRAAADAHCVFDEMPKKTTVGWNTIIAGYALHGYSDEALSMYYDMRDSGVPMDHFTFSMIIRICARLASLEHAKQAHAGLVRHGFGLDIVANTSLVDFYSKWGRIEDARHVFDQIPNKNVISWNALIAGYGNHGRGDEAVEMFEKMLEERMVPNHVTFLAVLSACSRSGLSERGWEIFESMSRDYKVKPRAMHYACMIELLGQEGNLDEAFALIRAAPFKPTANMWAALLTACRINENLELGKIAAKELYGMEPQKLSNYVVLLNIYNSCGKLKEATAVVQTLRRKGLRMLPACSWIEIKKQVHIFHSGDERHAQTREIYETVDDLMVKIRRRGYIRDEKHLLPDVDEHERISAYHSEKLAIAYGLISTSDGTPLQIVQGHRICPDCHSAIKLIAKVTEREIVVRDASRFHHFKNGSCSCGNYW